LPDVLDNVMQPGGGDHCRCGARHAGHYGSHLSKTNGWVLRWRW
jgi:hypothetical protein